MCQSVIFGSLILRKRLVLISGEMKFSKKTRIEHVMLKFLATTENIRKLRSEDSDYNRGKIVKNSSGKLLFPISDTSFEREESCLIRGRRQKITARKGE